MHSISRTLQGIPTRAKTIGSLNARINQDLNQKRGFVSLSLLTSAAQYGAVAALSYGIYGAYTWRHPRAQAPIDSEKKTIVVLGSGWASTSFLKSIDTSLYNLIVVSPRNYFLFTPLLPSTSMGTVDVKSIVEPIRFITRHKNRDIKVYEATCTGVDPEKKTIAIQETADNTCREVGYDYLVMGVGAKNATFGVKGVEKHANFLKEAQDAGKIHHRLMQCIEQANLPGQSQQEIDRLLHLVVVGGGATGIEYAAELHDFLKEDLRAWYPELKDKVKISLIEALPNVLPQFSRKLIDYTESTFKKQHIDIHTQTQVVKVHEKDMVVRNSKGELDTIPYGLLVWATGNTTVPLVNDLIQAYPEHQTEKRGLVVDDCLRLKGSKSIFALGDATATSYAPTAQVASQQGKYLAKQFKQIYQQTALQNKLESGEGNPEKIQKQLNKLKLPHPFHYSHQGSLCYIGSEKAIADLPLGPLGNLASGGAATFIFWRSAYLSNLFSFRNRSLVLLDWAKTYVLGRDISKP
ncbi:hypothetical protein BY458DRAFT_476793 [Sporodiniella umbellata]|nr:hypothetical protein BY458DRAFT_476793 [Sporodiniella umbellata]